MICHFFGDGLLEEILSQRVGCVGSSGVDVENLKPLNCEHNLHGFIWLFWIPIH